MYIPTEHSRVISIPQSLEQEQIHMYGAQYSIFPSLAYCSCQQRALPNLQPPTLHAYSIQTTVLRSNNVHRRRPSSHRSTCQALHVCTEYGVRSNYCNYCTTVVTELQIASLVGGASQTGDAQSETAPARLGLAHRRQGVREG